MSLNNSFDKEYQEYVAESIKDKTFFREGYEWYASRYLRASIDRTFFLLLSVIGVFIIFNIFIILQSTFPLKEEYPIIISSPADVNFISRSIKLENKQESRTTDEEILAYLVKNYILERESHNYKNKFNNAFTSKLLKIRNMSSIQENERFKKLMRSENPASPSRFIGKNVEQIAKIINFSFDRVESVNLWDKAKDYISKPIIPTSAKVIIEQQTLTPSQNIKRKYRILLTFKFEEIDPNKDIKENEKINFFVTSYKKIPIK